MGESSSKQTTLQLHEKINETIQQARRIHPQIMKLRSENLQLQENIKPLVSQIKHLSETYYPLKR